MRASEIDTATRLNGMILKICGMTLPADIARVAALAPSMMGFIFYDKTPRSAIGLDPRVISALPPAVIPVAVFVDAPGEEILSVVREYGFRVVQLHGAESPALCLSLRRRGLTVIKALHVAAVDDLAAAKAYENAAHIIILDTKTQLHGGSGRKFDWRILQHYSASIPYLLSGGIGPDDIDRIIAHRHPHMLGIDINSRFETSPGVKDIPAITQFINNLTRQQ